MQLLQLHLQALVHHSAGISGTSVNVNAIARSQHLPEVYVPALPSGHGGGAPNATPLLTTAGPQPLHSHTSLLKDAEAKLSQTCAELDATKSQLQVLDVVAAFDVCSCATGSTCQHFCITGPCEQQHLLLHADAV